MSSSFNLTPTQKRFWKKENHNYGRPSLALIYPNGEVVLDYKDEILVKYKNEQYCDLCGEKKCQGCLE